MMKTQARASVARQAAKAACLGIFVALFFQSQLAWAGQHGGSGGHGGGHSAPHSSSASHGQSQSRPQPPFRSPSAVRPEGGGQPQRLQPGYGSGGAPARPPYNGTPYSVRPQTAGHLPDWMAQHRNLPVGQQERLLRGEPGFNRLNPGEQQREIQELHELNQLPEAQRERRLARNEAIERLSPVERMQTNQAFFQLRALAPDRQVMVHRAFHDLRGVPVDQRDTMLNSARYSSAFSPQERGILSNLLRVEPYEGPR
jgi:hypothetical protein